MRPAKFGKYWAFFQTAWQRQLILRFEALTFVAINAISMFSVLYFWDAVFGSQAAMAGFTKGQIVGYYLMFNFTSGSLDQWIGANHDINTGNVSNLLVRPVSYLWAVYWQNQARRLMRLLMGLPILLVLAFALRSHLELPTSPLNWLMMLLALFGASNIFFLVQMTVELGEFWIKNSDSLSPILDPIKWFLSGGLIPLAMLPLALQKITSVTPFPYAGAFLMDALFGRLTAGEYAFGLAVQTMWVLALSWLVTMMWRAGLRRYEAYGN